MPVQESGVRHLRPAPYELLVDAVQDSGSVTLSFVNRGRTAVVFHSYAAIEPTSLKTYTVNAGTQLSDTWATVTGGGATYDLTVTAPNGFLRRFAGGGAGVSQEVTAGYEGELGDIYLTFVNSGSAAATFTVTDNSYGRPAQKVEVPSGATVRREVPLQASHSWYDLTVTSSADAAFIRRFAGHVETGRASVTDPVLSTGACPV
jgi:phospholipase C